jgi:hypothetical protein
MDARGWGDAARYIWVRDGPERETMLANEREAEKGGGVET